MSRTRAVPFEWEFYLVREPAARWKWRRAAASGWTESSKSFGGFAECLLDAKRNGFVASALPHNKTVLDLIRASDVDGLNSFSQLMKSWTQPRFTHRSSE